jgi:hypothetical protein
MRKEVKEELDRCIAGAKTEEERAAAAKKFHDFVTSKDKEYIKRLFQESRDTDQNRHRGKEPPRWDAHHDWTREHLGKIRDAFVAKGSNSTTFSQLGLWASMSQTSPKIPWRKQNQNHQ